MDQIRELLIGEFVQDTNNKFESLQRKVDAIQEEYRENIGMLSNSFDTKLEKLEQSSNDHYQYLQEYIDVKMQEQTKLTTNSMMGLKEELYIQKEHINKSLTMVKKIFDVKLEALREEFSSKSVSKTSLASMFLEYSLKLKDSDIESEIKNEINQDIKR